MGPVRRVGLPVARRGVGGGRRLARARGDGDEGPARGPSHDWDGVAAVVGGVFTAQILVFFLALTRSDHRRGVVDRGTRLLHGVPVSIRTWGIAATRGSPVGARAEWIWFCTGQSWRNARGRAFWIDGFGARCGRTLHPGGHFDARPRSHRVEQRADWI